MSHFNKPRNAAFYVHSTIGLFLMFFAGRIFEPIEPLTEVGMQIVGLFVGLVWMWCFVGFLWPSLLGLIAFGLSDFTANFAQVGTMSFGGAVPILLLFSMILFGSPQHVGATQYITRFFLTRDVFNNRPIVFSFVFFFATYILSIAVNVTPALILMWSVLYGVLKELDYTKGEKFTSLMLVGTFLGAISGQASLPFTGSTLAILSAFTEATIAVEVAAGVPVEYAVGIIVPAPQYMLLGFIDTVIIMIIYCLFMKLVLKPEELTKVAHVNSEMFAKDPLPPMSPLQKANFFSVLLFVFFMLLPWFLPDGFIIAELLGTLGAGGVAILITAVMCFVRVQGEPILDFGPVASKSINWDVYVMVSVALAISSALTSPATGVLALMENVFRPILGGHSAMMLFIMTLLVAIFITSFANTMVLGITFMPILVFFGAEAAVNLPALASVTIILLHYAIILPSASPFAAMLWSNEEWITRKEVFQYAAVIIIAATIVSIAILMPISLILF